MTADQLAEELEVSVRTIYRDIDSLHAAGIPLYAEAGHDGGYRLVGGYRTRLTGLNTGEAEALLLSSITGPATDLGLGPALAAAQLKLEAALPPMLWPRPAGCAPSSTSTRLVGTPSSTTFPTWARWPTPYGRAGPSTSSIGVGENPKR
jgi:predicted DNA-binding transcriptional regulator YafY